MAKPPQLTAVVIALALVVSAAGYGIVRGVLADDQKSETATTWRSVAGCHAGEELPVDNSLLLPTQLPEGVCLCLTNYSAGAPGTLWYNNEQGDKVFLVSFLKGSFAQSATQTQVPIQLGNLTGYVADTTADGIRSYDISFEKAGWTYYVVAQVGKRSKRANAPDNTVTPDELKAVAQSIAEQ